MSRGKNAETRSRREPASRSREPRPVPRRSREVVLVLGNEELRGALVGSGFEVVRVEHLEEALEPPTSAPLRAVVLSEESLSPGGTQRAVTSLRRHRPLTDVLVWAPSGDPVRVRGSLKGGARDVVLDPDPERAAARVREVVDAQLFLPEVQRLQGRRRKKQDFEGMVGRSPEMWDLFETCARVAPTGASVLIRGETGTGKDLLARALHRRSGREGRFVAVNCAALSEALVDAELFGHERGTFTGAVRSRQGLFRHAEGGTLFLDEIGAVPLPVQFSLLRVLQEECVRPVGGHEEIPVDVRVVAATNEPLEEAVARGDFREDLLYRLDVIRLVIPPLRERSGDLLYLFNHFLRRFSKSYKLPRPKILEGFLDALIAYPWPGNIRQLENFTERLLLTHGGEDLRAEHFHGLIEPGQGSEASGAVPTRERPDRILPEAPGGLRGPLPQRSRQEPRGSSRGPGADPDTDLSASATSGEGGGDLATLLDPESTLAENLERVRVPLERAYFEALLRRYRGRVGLVAEHAGVHRRTVLRKLQALGLDKNDFRTPR